MKLKEKKINNTLEHELIESGIHPVLAKIFAARKIHNADEINYKLDKLLSPDLLLSNIEVGDFLYEAILANKKIVIVGDYDADGATACACGMKGLKKFGVDIPIENNYENSIKRDSIFTGNPATATLNRAAQGFETIRSSVKNFSNQKEDLSL